MQMVTGKKIIWLAIAMLLSACSTVGNKTPDELVRLGIQRNLMRDNQFNFNGQIRLLVDQKVETSSNQVTDETLDEETEAIDSAFLSEPVRKKHEIEMSAKAAKESNGDNADFSEENVENNRKKRALFEIINSLTQNTTIQFSGAVDLPQLKLEVIPELHYEATNMLYSMKMPIQLDLKKKILVTDVSAIKPFINLTYFIGHDFDKILDKPYYAVNISEQLYSQLPLKELIRVIPTAIDQGFSTYDKKAFVRLPMDGAGKRIGARYRIQFSSNDKQNRMMVAVFDSLSKELKQLEEDDTSLNSQGDESKKKDYAVMQELLAEIRETLQNNKLNMIKYDNKIINFYLDSRGRILAIRKIYGFLPAKLIGHDILDKTISVSFWIQFDYTSQPKFTINPTPAGIFYHNLNNARLL